jgi:DNA-binding FadR family transcriptional regulator
LGVVDARGVRGRVGTQRVAPLVDAADNLAYRLAYNSLRATYDQCRALFTQVMADEIADVAPYRAIAAAVRRRDAAAAERLARELIQRGERGIKTALRQLDEEDARA